VRIGWIYALGLVAVGGALAIILRATPPWMLAGDVKEEAVKIGLQVFVFGLAGGGVKLLLDRQTEHRKFRAEMLDRLGQAHKRIFRVRRLLPVSSAESVHELLGELMDARQDLGATNHAVRVGGLGARIEEIQQETKTMRDYLDEVIRGALAEEGSAERGVYTAFLSWNTQGPYEERFKKSYLNAKKLVDPSFKPPEAL
jgi:hypothetical protein